MTKAVDALSPCFTRQMGCAAAFLFAYRIMPTAMVTFTTFTYAQFTLPNWAYSGLLLVSMGAGIAATYAHRQLSNRLSLPASFVLGALANAACGLGRLGVVYSWNGAEDKVSAPTAALVTSNLLSSFGQLFGYMPILALAAQSAPPGLEAFGYSLLLFIADLGSSGGSFLAAEVTKGLGLGAGDDRSWSNLAAMIWMCALFKLVPLPLLPLIGGIPPGVCLRANRANENGGGGEGQGQGEGGARLGECDSDDKDESMQLTDVAAAGEGDETLLLSAGTSSSSSGGPIRGGQAGRKYLIS